MWNGERWFCSEEAAPRGLAEGAPVNLNNLLTAEGIDPAQVLVMRHRPMEPQLNVSCSLASEKPDVFNAYQQNSE